jgi:hypothetical protein
MGQQNLIDLLRPVLESYAFVCAKCGKAVDATQVFANESNRSIGLRFIHHAYVDDYEISESMAANTLAAAAPRIFAIRPFLNGRGRPMTAEELSVIQPMIDKVRQDEELKTKKMSVDLSRIGASKNSLVRDSQGNVIGIATSMAGPIKDIDALTAGIDVSKNIAAWAERTLGIPRDMQFDAGVERGPNIGFRDFGYGPGKIPIKGSGGKKMVFDATFYNRDQFQLIATLAWRNPDLCYDLVTSGVIGTPRSKIMSSITAVSVNVEANGERQITPGED